MLVAFFRNKYIDASLFSFISFVFLITLALSSYNIEQNYCSVGYTSFGNVTTPTWSCYTKISSNGSLSYLYLGLGLLMFIFGIIFAFTETAE